MITKLKEQGSKITTQKIEEICSLLPELANEINWSRGVTTKGKDSVVYKWKNGSVIDTLPATDTSRGQRRNAGIMEEAVLINGDALNEIVIPIMNIDRLLPDGTRDPKEHINQGQIYITSAGYKSSFAYQRLVEIYVDSVVEPDDNIVLSGTYKIPVKEGLLKKNFVQNLQLQGTYSEESFEREFLSKGKRIEKLVRKNKNLKCWDILKLLRPQQNHEKRVIVTVTKVEKMQQIV